jgi:tetratricopeptide (TPR) repeat protein
MGHVYYLRQEFAWAVSAYREAIKIDPSLTDTQFSLALALFKQKDFVAAKELSNYYQPTQPMLCHYYLAHILISQGELETNRSSQTALRIDPQYADGHLL